MSQGIGPAYAWPGCLLADTSRIGRRVVAQIRFSVDHHFAALELFVALLFAFPDVAEGGTGFWSQAADCLDVEGHRMRFSGSQGARLGAGGVDELLGGF